MYLPDSNHLGRPIIYTRSFPGFTFLNDKDANAGDWSSFIGIVTAICGNILISFALNTQRYAHIRLERERDEEERRRLKGKDGGAPGYGTQQDDVAQERERLNSSVRGNTRVSNGLNDGYRRDIETDQLLPQTKNRRASVGSGSTIRGNEKQDSVQSKSYLKSPYWWAGLVMITTGEAGNFLAYGFAPASIVSPLGVVALISNCIIAPFMLKERFRARDALGVLVAIGGAVTVVLSAESSDPKLGPDQIWDLIKRWEFETYLGITLFCIILLATLSKKYGDKTILIDLGLVGLFGGYTALSTKGIASLLSYRLWMVVTFPVTYLLLAILIFTAIMQVKYVNRALQRFDSTQVIPTQFVMFTLFVILGSAILYRDFENRSAEDAAKFFGGCALTFLGVWLITSGRGKGSEDEELGEDENAINLVDEERFQNTVAQYDQPRRKPSYASGSQKGFSTTDLPEDRHAPAMPRMHSAPEYAVSITSELARAPSPSEPSTPLSAHDDSRGPSLDYESALSLPKNPWASGTPSPAPSSSSQYPLPQQHQRHPTPSPLGLPNPPVLNTTSSDSIVPTSTHSSSHRPLTPRHQQYDPLSNANLSNHITPDRRTAVNPRHSLTDMFTTPLTAPLSAPLSGSLSAVVADSLRQQQRSRRQSLRGSAAGTKRRSQVGGVDSPVLGRWGVSEPELVPQVQLRGEDGNEDEDEEGSEGEREREGEEMQNSKSRSKSVGETLEAVFRKGKGLRRGLRRGKSERTEGEEA
ncbi:DUF803-domain-containing protein [Viridothelium virens]|uniref:DUF803-domain-containing protein n=1 Tax=Viridothelium virens TaxID=1048519 RepID=A0A6A6HLE5_VIRVR|nr:DUF803-domain-containing protein [Viridothelium virens]